MTILCLKEKVEIVNFPVGADEEYKDESHAIQKLSAQQKMKTVSVTVTCYYTQYFFVHLFLISSLYFGQELISNV